MSKKKLFVFYFILATIILPFSLFLNVNVEDTKANWLETPYEMTYSSYDSSRPNIAFDSSGVMHFVYVKSVPEEEGYFEICLGNNSNLEDPDDIIDRYFEITELQTGASHPMNTTYNFNPQIAIDGNDIVHVVWQGKHGDDPNGNYDIFYTNSSNGDYLGNMMNVTDDSWNNIDPTIATVNDSVYIAYFDENANDIRMKTTEGTRHLDDASPLDPTSGTGCTMPTLIKWINDTNDEDWRLDFAYLNSLGQITIAEHNETEKIEDLDLSSHIKCVITENSVVNYSIDSNERMVAVSFIKGNHIYVTNTTSGGIVTQITSTALDRAEPEVTINNNDIITVFWIENDTYSAANVSLQFADNYGNYFKNISTFILKNNFIYEDLINIDINSFDVENWLGDSVFILYSMRKRYDDEWDDNHMLYISAYAQMYDNGTIYNQFSYDDNLMGYVSSEGYIIEGLQLNFNTSLGRDTNLTVTVTDYATSDTWEYEMELNGTGGNDYTVRFYREDGIYFVGYNKFKVELNLSNSISGNRDMIKLELDPLDFAPENFNFSNNADGDDRRFNYTIQDLSSGYEATIFLFDKALGTLKREDTKQTPFTKDILDDENYVDLYKFEMIPGETYRMNLDVDKHQDKVKLLVYDSVPSLISTETALEVYSMSDYDGKEFIVSNSEKEDNVHYYIAIIKYNKTAGLNYTFTYNVCPLAAKLIAPLGKYLGENPLTSKVSYVFEWDLNDDEDLFTDDDISGYNFEIYDSKNQLISAKSKYSFPNKTINVTLVGAGYNDLPDGTYKWRVQIIAKNGQNSFAELSQSVFYIDTSPPKTPNITAPDSYFTIGTYRVEWTVPSDDLFSVHHYELYSSKNKNFEPSVGNLVDDNIRFPSKVISGKETGLDYYKVVAVDNVGLKSDPSDPVGFMVSLFGYVDVNGTFYILPGDYLEYQVTEIIEEEIKDPSKLYATINGERFQANSLFHYYITEVDSENYFPVMGDLYKKGTNITAQQTNKEYDLFGSDVDVAPFALTNNLAYQKEVFNLFLTRHFGEEKELFYALQRSRYSDVFSTIDVYVHTFYGNHSYADEFSDSDVEYTQAIFIVDANKGILIEMSFYDEWENEGYSIKLIGTNIGLSRLQWWVAPLMIVMVLGIIAAIMNQIVKKLERRI